MSRWSSPGDHVVLSLAPYCGHCYYCAIGKQNLCVNMFQTMVKAAMIDGTCRLKKKGKDIHHMAGISSFAEQGPWWQNRPVSKCRTRCRSTWCA